uniref:FAD-binding FR-type domain-containing protein n=1 Tax=Stomoxys calcitrans TaxID=35570 RepID=A0A1I8PH31_STOCA
MNNSEYTNDNEECCGNGCANCVLNIQPKKSKQAIKAGKVNILTEYTNFCLLDKVRHSNAEINAWELHFKSSILCGGHKTTTAENFILDIEPGYHLMLRRHMPNVQNEVGIENKRKYLLRPYSPYWWDMQQLEFKILVNFKFNGPMTNFLRHIQVGDEAEFRGPIGQFEYRADAKGNQILFIITQGVAVAPVRPIIENILDSEEDLTRIVHLACYEDIQHIYFRKELYDFKKFWNYKCDIYLAHELCDRKECIENAGCMETCTKFIEKLKYKESVHPFRLTTKELEAKFNLLGEDTIEHVSVVIAGTGKFQNTFKDLLTSEHCGLNDKNVHLL